MRQRTAVEKIADRGTVVRLEISDLHSTLMPQWWEVKRRFLWWRLKQRVRSDRKGLAMETQAALAWAEEALEREFLYREGDIV